MSGRRRSAGATARNIENLSVNSLSRATGANCGESVNPPGSSRDAQQLVRVVPDELARDRGRDGLRDGRQGLARDTLPRQARGGRVVGLADAAAPPVRAA